MLHNLTSSKKLEISTKIIIGVICSQFCETEYERKIDKMMVLRVVQKHQK